MGGPRLPASAANRSWLRVTRRGPPFAAASAALAVTLSGCAVPVAAPPLPAGVRDIAVLPTSNQTGRVLEVEYGGLLNLIVAARTLTVPEVLDESLRAELRARGFVVAEPATVTRAVGETPPTSVREAVDLTVRCRPAPVALFIVLEQWEPDLGPANNFVDVALEAWLIDAPRGRVIWTYRRRLQPVPTQGMPNVGEAYVAAARQLADDLVATWRPSSPNP